jgi:hypothetical protein
MTISVADDMVGIEEIIVTGSKVNLDPSGGRLSTTSLMGTDAHQANISAASDLAKNGPKWTVTAINSSADRGEAALISVGGGNAEGTQVFSRYALTLQSTLSSGLSTERTLFFVDEAAAEDVLSVWPQVSSSDVDESKLKRYLHPAMEVYNVDSATTVLQGDHVSVDQVTCVGTLGGTTPRSDLVAKYGGNGSGGNKWFAGYSLSEDSYGLILKTNWTTSFAKGDGVFQAASGGDTTTGERIGTVLQVFDLHFGVKFSPDF